MEPSPQARVLRCCCCRVFQAYQVKKSLKWTCKVCGEQQSFLRAYGEGSGADCRRHVQKLNLLQARLSETPLRSPEVPVHAGRERNAGPGLAELLNAQEEPQPSRNRWQKYLERGSGELGLQGAVGFSSWSSSSVGKLNAPSGTRLPRTRRWSQSEVQPPHSPAGQDTGDSEVTSQTQKGHTSLPGKSEGVVTRPGTLGRALGLGGHQCATQQVRAMPSQWVRFFPPPGNSAQVDTEPSTLLQRGPVPAGAAQAEQGTPQDSNHKTTGALQLPWATHTPCGPRRPFEVIPEQLWGTGPQAEGGPLVRGAPESRLVRLQDLFNTGEDFDDVL
ncbi:LOW QUALITY PROTEIN: MRN complex-interacting protein [Phyllostomus discolor]|uniref:LOW QUALITY PROTEIN: MRN complex-interacting protein n=1 Tax=Phyllostomus discolor TaxID=89673 RepID=A0A7E6CTC6_9CHIR|nr:LOW QUALITY PROTEIN: MRN complex-interacting protein [Phyllostomus discolor]